MTCWPPDLKLFIESRILENMSGEKSAEETPFSRAMDWLSRDLNFDFTLMISAFVQTVFGVLAVSFAILLILGESTYFPAIPSDIQIVYWIFGILTFLLGGIVIDYINKLQVVQYTANFATLVCIFLGVIFPVLFPVFLAILTISSTLTVLISFNLFIGQTTILNRGRYIILLVLLLAVVLSPLLYLIIAHGRSIPYFLGVLVIMALFIYGWEHKYPLPRQYYQREEVMLEMTQNQDAETILKEEVKPLDLERKSRIKAMLRTYGQTIIETGLIPYFFISFLISAVIGFNLSFIPTDFQPTFNLVAFILIAFASIIAMGILTDFKGRKIIVLLCVCVMAFYMIFFDYSDARWYYPLWFYLFPFTMSAAFVFVMSIFGDLSDVFRRGQIISFILFAVLAGFIFGLELEHILNLGDPREDIYVAIAIADFGSLALFIALLILNYIPETFHPEAIHWRTYIQRVLILHNNGVNVFDYNFQEGDEDAGKGEGPDPDLVSGGLTGIQSLLKEISSSKEQLEILDHADKKIIFAHGKHTTIVLFSTKYLAYLKNKLTKFQEEFEYYNKERLEHFKGNVHNLNQLGDLMKKYFDVDLSAEKKP